MSWARAFAIAVCCAYPLLNHAAALLPEPRWAALGLALVAWVLASGWFAAPLAALVAAAALASSLWVAAAVPELLLFVPPVLINLAFFAFFARTLRRGSEPLVSRFARAARGGQLPRDLARYTRNLTWAWAGFFMLMAAISATLAATGPLAAWSLFTNLMNYLLVVLFFIVEYVYRRVRYRHHPHVSPWQMVSRLRDFKAFARSSSEAPKSP